ncbi:MAG: AAA family ATPase [Bacteroidota bacterium]
MKDKFHITVGRQIGSGGHEIGEKLAGELGIAFYDRELINIAAKQSGLGKESFEDAEEKKSFSLLAGFPWFGGNAEEFPVNSYLGNENLFKIQSDVIRDLAGKESAVFVGRCADYVLSEFPACLNLFICADTGDRIRRISERRSLTESKALEYLEKMDKRRAAYYNFYSNKTWGEASSYHLCINSSVFGIDQTVELIRHYVEKRFALK